MEQTRQFGNYLIMQDGAGKLRMLGSGTFGRTYLAKHDFLETLAALKVINDRFAAQPAARERFLQEGRALDRLKHGHIARLLEFGEVEKQLFYAMEYCAGGDFAQRIKQHGPLPAEVWLRVARQTASALECCHRAGFIHRDLKPSNIMLTAADGPVVVKLIDFGLVHAEHRGTSGVEAMMGTPLYASPEQLREDAVDARTDLFSLGMTLWHLAIGAPPESGSSAEVIKNRLSPESYASRISMQLPAQIREVIVRLIEKDKDARPSSATEVLAMLADADPGERKDLACDVASCEEDLNETMTVVLSQIAPELMEIEQTDRPLTAEYELEAAMGEQHTGKNWLALARQPGRERSWLHIIQPALVTDSLLFHKLRVACAQLRRQHELSCLSPMALRIFKDATVLISAAPGGEVLADLLKRKGKCSLAAALPLLRRIAETSDCLVLAGLPGVEIRANRIFVSPEAIGGSDDFELMMVPRLLASQETPDLASAITPGDGISNTISAELLEETAMDDQVPLLARLVYRLVAGRDCASAASVSTRAYSPVADLPEASDRLLRQVIVGETERATCADFLAELQGFAGVTGTVGGHGLQNQSSRGSSRAAGTGSSLPPAAASQASSAAASRPGSVAGSATPPRPFHTSPPATPPPPPPPAPLLNLNTRKELPISRAPARLRRWAMLGAAVAALAVIAGGWWKYAQSDAPDDIGDDSAPSQEVKKIPLRSVLQISGDIPLKTVWTAGDAPVQLTTQNGRTEIPLVKGAALPLLITAKAPGYQIFRHQIAKLADLQQPVALELKRTTGTVMITWLGQADYASISARMMQALPEEEGVVPVERFTIGEALPAKAKNVRCELPTGYYQLSLVGMNHAVRTRLWQSVIVKSGAEQTCSLPPSYAGRFSGKLTDGGTAAGKGGESPSVELNFSETLNEGELRGENQRVVLNDIQVDSSGVLTATARLATAPLAPAYDQSLTAQLAKNGQELEVKLTEIFRPTPEDRAALQRPAYSDREWFRRGTLMRQK